MTKSKLPFKQLIVTRPKGQADKLISSLTDDCHNTMKVTHLPLLQITSVKAMLPNLSQLNGIIFISTNAVEHFFSQFAHASFPAKIQFLAVGDKTAEELKRKVKRSVSYPLQMNSEGLIDLPELQSVENKNWLIVKGMGGRDFIQQTLLSRGAKVTELAVYQRQLPSNKIQQKIKQANLQASLWLITSAEALNSLHKILNLNDEPKHQTAIIVSSERLKTLATQKGFTIIAQSLGASTTQLVQCIQSSMLH